MLRLKALFRARGIPASGKRVYQPSGRGEWLAQLLDAEARSRAAVLYAELDVLRQNAQQSALAKPALDNRSHRTTCVLLRANRPLASLPLVRSVCAARRTTARAFKTCAPGSSKRVLCCPSYGILRPSPNM